MDNYKLIVYDLDGTLIDTAEDVVEILNEMRLTMNKKKMKKLFFYPWLSLGGEDLIKNSLETDNTETDKLLSLFRSKYYKLKESKSRAFPKIKETLQCLYESNFKLAICTNKPRNLALKVLNDFDLVNYFQFILAGGDLEKKKPDPMCLAKCIDYFNLNPSETLLVGDSKIDQILAKKMNVDFAFYKPGYDDGVNKTDTQYIFESHSDIKNILKGL